MFTEKDFLAYFSELDILEKNMRDTYAAMLNDLSNKDIKDVIQNLVIEETDHMNIVSKLRHIAIKKSL